MNVAKTISLFFFPRDINARVKNNILFVSCALLKLFNQTREFNLINFCVIARKIRPS